MLTEYKEFGIELVEKMYIPEAYGAEEYDDFDSFCISDVLDKYDESYSINSGASKVCVVFSNLPFVLKIPFNGKYYYEEYYDEDAECYCYNYDEPAFIDFECSSDIGGAAVNDYCDAECVITRMIKNSKFAKIVPEMESIYCDKYGRNYYIQEKVIPSSCRDEYRNKTNNVSKDSYDKASHMKDDYKMCSTNWRASVIESYGENFWEEFVDFCKENEIDFFFTDMHCGNYGYREDGTPVIFDLSGYFD